MMAIPGENTDRKISKVLSIQGTYVYTTQSLMELTYNLIIYKNIYIYNVAGAISDAPTRLTKAAKL